MRNVLCAHHAQRAIFEGFGILVTSNAFRRFERFELVGDPM